jgi:outer membrane protein TolC
MKIKKKSKHKSNFSGSNLHIWTLIHPLPLKIFALGAFIILDLMTRVPLLKASPTKIGLPVKSTPSISEPKSLWDLKTRLGIAPLEHLESSEKFSAPSCLEPLVQFAIDQHPALATEKVRVNKSEFLLKLAKDRFGPTASLGAQKGISQYPDDVGTSRIFAKSSSAGVTVSQNIWNGGQDLLSYRQEALGVEAAELEFKNAQKSLIWRVRMAGLSYQQAAMDLWIAEQSLKNSQEIVHLSKQKSQAGQVGKIDVMQSEQQLTQAMTQVTSAQIKLFKNLENLEKILLLTPLDPRRSSLQNILKDLVAQPMARPEKSWMTQLDTNSWTDKDLERQRQQKLIAQKELEISKSRRNRWLPSVDLSLSYQKRFEPKEPTTFGAQEKQPINATLSLDWPLWDQTKNTRIDLAQTEVQELHLKDEESIRLTQLSIIQSLAQLERLFSLFEINKTSFEQSEALYQAKIQLYRAGAIDIIALTNAANDRLGVIQSIYGTICELQKEWFQLIAHADGVKL